MRAAGHAGAGFGGAGAVEDLFPRLGGQIADFEIGTHVAGIDAAPGVDEREIASGGARNQARLAEDLLHQAEIEIGAEPVLGAARLEQLDDERLHGACGADAVGGLVVDLVELEAVVQGGRGHLAAVAAAELVDLEQLVAVVVLEGGRKAEIAAAGGDEAAHGGHFALETVFLAADGVVPRAEAFEGNADLDVGVLADDALELVALEAVGGNFELAGLGMEEIDDLLEVGAERGLAAGEVEIVESGGELGEDGGGDLFGGEGRVLPDVAHGAARIAAVGQDDGEIHGGGR